MTSLFFTIRRISFFPYFIFTVFYCLQAYRLEPLVHHNYRFIRPIKLFSSIDLRALKDYDLLPPELHRSYIKKLKTREKREKDKEVKEVISEKERDDIDEEDECDSDESSALRPNSSWLLFRMDYQVQPQITERSYWSVLKSHFTYWTNADLATFVVNRLYSKEEKSADSGDS
uniref:DDHD domain-containing protein n=1 Tax=Parascaris equorum TaxID=6256 RepID=A0A914RI66_PAREQ